MPRIPKPAGKKPKIFILDTNVILHDHRAVRKFQETHGLPVTGEADADTQKAIDAAGQPQQ